MTFFALPKVAPRSPASLGAEGGRAAGASPARSTSGSDRPSALRPPTRSHSRRESLSAAWSRMESMVPPPVVGRSRRRDQLGDRLAVLDDVDGPPRPVRQRDLRVVDAEVLVD